MLRKHLGSSLGVKERPNGHSSCRVCKLSGPLWEVFVDRSDALANAEFRELLFVACPYPFEEAGDLKFACPDPYLGHPDGT
jgi:hypothetical protein